MKIIILAAGQGTRLYPLTADSPKCLLDIDKNTPFLMHTLDSLLELFSAEDINIVIGYKQGKIINFLEKIEKFNKINCIYNPFYKFTNSIVSLHFCEKIFNSLEPVLVINSDVYFDKEMLRHFIFNYSDSIIVDSSVCQDYQIHYNFKSNLAMHSGKNLSSKYSRKNLAEYIGITQFYTAQSKKCIIDNMADFIADGKYDTWYETALNECFKIIDFEIFDIADKFPWVEIDTYKDLLKVREVYKAGEKKNG